MNELLEKYWGGETTLTEERELKARLQEEKGTEELEEVQMLFEHFDKESKVELDDSFDQMILNEIGKEEETRVISLSSYFRQYSRIAAAVVVMLVSGYLFVQEQNKLETEDTFESPEAAYEELKKQLLIVSNYLNKGNSAVEGFGSLGTVETELQDFSKLGGASQGFEMLGEMNVKNN